MWYRKLFGIIDRVFVSKDEKRMNLISSLDPDRIYIENIRSILNISTSEARTICNMAVKDGVFRKKIGIYCPGCNRIIKTYNKEGEVEEILDCDNCELEGEQFEYESKKLKKEEFYQFVTP